MLNFQPRRRPPAAPNFVPPGRSGANDNKRFRVHVPANSRRLARHGRALLRLNPYLRLAGELSNILNYLSAGAEEGFTNLGDWSVYAQCGAPDPSYDGAWGKGAATTAVASSAIANSTNGCSAGQGTSNVGDPWAGVTASRRSVGLGRTKEIAGSPRMQYQVAYTRPNSGEFQKPEFVEARAAIALVPPLPQFWPVTYNPGIAPPGLAPAFAPPVPYPRIPDWKAPNRQTSSGAGINPANDNIRSVRNNWAIGIGVSPRTIKVPKTHKMEPPKRKHEKEKKLKLNKAAVFAMKSLGFATEALDTLNAIYDALPVKYRPKYRSTRYELMNVKPQDKIRALIKHADKVDWDQAVQNIIVENAKDVFYGKLGKAGGVVSRRIGSQYGAGINTADRLLRKTTYDADRMLKELDGEQ